MKTRLTFWKTPCDKPFNSSSLILIVRDEYKSYYYQRRGNRVKNLPEKGTFAHTVQPHPVRIHQRFELFPSRRHITITQ